MSDQYPPSIPEETVSIPDNTIVQETTTTIAESLANTGGAHIQLFVTVGLMLIVAGLIFLSYKQNKG